MSPYAPIGAVIRPEFYRAPRTTSTRDGFEAVVATTATIVLYGIFGAIVKFAPIARNITLGTVATTDTTGLRRNCLARMKFGMVTTINPAQSQKFGTGCAICSDCTEETGCDGSADSHARFGPLTSET